MAPIKRKFSSFSASEESDADTISEGLPSDSDIDISAALIGNKDKGVHPEGVEDDDEELQELIRDSIAKRNVKGGTDMLKKTKGKARMAKGEVGGGSFQSMGRCLHSCMR